MLTLLLTFLCRNFLIAGPLFSLSILNNILLLYGRLNFDSFGGVIPFRIRYGTCVNTIRGSRADVANDSPNMS